MKILSLLLSLFLPFFAVAQQQSSYAGYVLNYGSPPPTIQYGNVSVFSTQLDTIDNSAPLNIFFNLPFLDNPEFSQLPIGMAIATTSDGTASSAYITNANVSLGTIGIIPVDLTTFEQQTTIPTPTSSFNYGPINILLNPSDSTIAYITNVSSTLPPVLNVLDLSSNQVTSLTIPGNPNGSLQPGLAIAGSTLYIVDQSGTLLPFDISISTNPVAQKPIQIGYTPFNIVVTSDGSTAYIATTNIDGDDAPLIVVNLSDNSIQSYSAASIAYPDQQLTGALAITSFKNTTSQFVYVTTTEGVAVFDTASQTFIKTIPFDSTSMETTAIAITPDNQFAYVTINNTNPSSEVIESGSIAKIEVESNELVNTFSSGGYFPLKIIFTSQSDTAVFDASPLAGPASGGTAVTLTGTGFTGTTSVLFGSNPATFTQTSDNTIVAISPPGEPGTIVSITVVTTHGKSRPSHACCHTYLPSTFEPTHLQGFQVKNKFATQTDRINILRWEPPTQGDKIVSYQIYRDSAFQNLIATVPASGPLAFSEHNRRKKPYTYFIVSVNQSGNHSEAESVTIAPQ